MQVGQGFKAADHVHSNSGGGQPSTGELQFQPTQMFVDAHNGAATVGVLHQRLADEAVGD